MVSVLGINIEGNIERKLLRGEEAMNRLIKMGIMNIRMPITAKIRIFKTFIRPILEYALAAMELTNFQWTKLEKGQLKLLEKCIGCKSYHDKVFQAVTRVTTLRQ